MSKKELTVERLLDALDSVCWYNGYAECHLLQLRDEIEKLDDSEYSYQLEYDWNNTGLQVIWMIMVCLYGDYGTSPRGGWLEIENKKEILKFIDNITVTAREHIAFEELNEALARGEYADMNFFYFDRETGKIVGEKH